MNKAPKGFLLPEIIDPESTICVSFEIPNTPEYRQAVSGHIFDLGHWYVWEHGTRGDTRAKEAAELFRTHIFNTLTIDGACIVNCEDIENCLESSTIILNLQNAITLIQGENTAQDEEIERLRDEPTDGNIYPPAPAIQTASACGAAWFIVEQFRAWIAAFEAAADTELTIYDAIDAIWNLQPNKLGNAVADILQGIFGNVVSVLTEFDTYAEAMREYLYCESNNRADFGAYLTTLGLTEILAYLDCLTQSAWDRWVYLGGFDLTRNCVGYCTDNVLPITVDFEDAGNYLLYSAVSGTVQASQGVGGTKALRSSKTCSQCGNAATVNINFLDPQTVSALSIAVYTRFATISWSVILYDASNNVLWSVSGNPVTSAQNWTTLAYSGINMANVSRIYISNSNGSGAVSTFLDNRLDNIVVS